MSPAKKNALANYGNFLAFALLGLIANPLLVGYLGTTAFGAWKGCQRLLDFSTVADGRATQALKWFIAHGASDTDSDHKRRQVGASLVVWAIWFPLLVLLQVGIVLALPHLISGIPESLETALLWTGIFMALNVLVTGIATIPDSVLVGSNMGYRSMIVTTAVAIVSNLVFVVLAYLGFGIPYLALTLFISTLVNGAITLKIAKRHISWFGAAPPKRKDVASLAKFSGWVLGWALVSKFLLSSEIILIGSVVGADAVAKFIFTSYLIQFALAICLMTASALMPGLGTLLGKGDIAQAREMARGTRDIVFAFATAFCCLFLLFNAPFVRLWAGETYFLGPATNVAMALAFLQLALIRCDAQIQDTGLRIGRKVMIGFLCTVASLGLGYLLLVQTESIAMMFAGLIIGRLPMSVSYPLMLKQMFNTSGYLSWPAVLSAVALVVGSIFLAPHIPDGLGFIASAAIGLIAIPFVCFYALLSKPTQAKIWQGRKRGAL